MVNGFWLGPPTFGRGSFILQSLTFWKGFCGYFYFLHFRAQIWYNQLVILLHKWKLLLSIVAEILLFFFRIIGALKIYNISYDRIDHFDPILKMDIIISRAMDDEEFSFYPIRKIKWWILIITFRIFCGVNNAVQRLLKKARNNVRLELKILEGYLFLSCNWNEWNN